LRAIPVLFRLGGARMRAAVVPAGVRVAIR